MDFISLPFLRIAGSTALPIKLGPVEIWQDTDDFWKQRARVARPRWLELFKEQPQAGATSSARGTVMFCEDRAWLELNVHNAVAVLYFLLDNSEPTVIPAEALSYYSANFDDNDTGVMIHTKHAFHWSLESSTQVLRPICTIGFREPRTIDTSSSTKRELVKLLESDPSNRIIVACRHYFRAHFAGFFESPIHQDWTCYCSALEAAANLSRGNDVSKRLSKIITAEYVVPSDPKITSRLGDWLSGLYDVRSSYVHGSSPNQRQASNNAFLAKSRRLNQMLLKCLVRDFIIRSLASPTRVTNHPGGLRWSKGNDMVRSFFLSDDLLRELHQWFTGANSATVIANLDRGKLEQFKKWGKRFCADFEPRFLTSHTKKRKLFQLLTSVSLAAAKLESLSKNQQSCIDIHTIAYEEDEKGLVAWRVKHGHWYDRTRTWKDRMKYFIVTLCDCVL